MVAMRTSSVQRLIRTRYRLKIEKIQRVEPLKSTHKMRNVRKK